MSVVINGTSGITFPNGVTMAAGTSSPVTVAQGGTGAASLTANNVLLGNGTSALQTVAPGANGNVLTSNGTTWTSSALPAGGVTSWNGATGAITTTTAYALGSFVIGRPQNNTVNYAVNSTIAGSSLYATGSSVGYNGSFWSTWYNDDRSSTVTLVNTGSWRCVSPAQAYAPGGQIASCGLWVRYA